MKLGNHLARLKRSLELSLGLTLAGCGPDAHLDRVATVADGESRWIHAVGRVEPVGQVLELAFENPGIVGTIACRSGDVVQEGTLLAQQLGGEEEALVLVAEAELEVARAEYRREEAESHPKAITVAEAAVREGFVALETARREAERHDRAVVSGGISAQAVDLAKSRFEQRSAALDRMRAELERLRRPARPEDIAVAREAVSMANAKVALARKRLRETELRAPCDGEVIEVVLRPGESTFGVAPITAVVFADLTQLQIRAEVEESQALEIQRGQAVEVLGIDSGANGPTIPGTVLEVRPIMGRKSVFRDSSAERTDVDVREAIISLPAQCRLPAGLRVDVRISKHSRQERSDAAAVF